MPWVFNPFTGTLDEVGSGAVGPPGPTGPAGPMGFGLDGLDGEEGQQGLTGAAGPTGAQGTPGTTGATGPPGLIGLSGLDGEDGLDGLTIIGPPGPIGPPGLSGSFLFPDSVMDEGFDLSQPTISLSQYLFLPGRPGTANNPLLSLTADGTITGSSVTAKGLFLIPNTVDDFTLAPSTTPVTIGSGLSVWPGLTAVNADSVLRSAIMRTGTVNLNNTGGGNAEFADILLAANYTSSNTIAPAYSALLMNGTITATVTPLLYSMNLFNAAPIMTSATDTVPPFLPDTFLDGTTVQQTAGSGSTAFAAISYTSRIHAKANGGNLAITGTTAGIKAGLYGLLAQANGLVATAGKTLTIDEFAGLLVMDASKSGAGAFVLTDQVGVDIQALAAFTNNIGIRSAIVAGANNYFLRDTGGAKSEFVGKFTKYNNVATAGWGVPGINGYARATAQTAANASVATYTVGAADGSFVVSANVLVTTSTTHNFTVTVAYTDEGGTARTSTFTFSNVGGTLLTAIINTAGAVPYEGVPLHIRAKAATTITVATTGTFTSVTYNVEGLIEQVA